jgi:DNA-binding CsgD family transcriptional regulator
MQHRGSVQCPLLVGRDDLLQLVDRRIVEAASGRGQLLMLAGEAGIGKTRLLGAAINKSVTSGFRAARGDLSPHDRQVPLASLLDLARTMRQLPAFGSLGSELLELQDGGHGGDTPWRRRARVHDLADRIVAAVDRPTLLAFEDLQWADEMSLEVLGELARRATGRPLLLLAAYRLDELPPGSLHREWRARLLSQRLAEEVRLERLSYDQTALVTTLILGTGLPAPREVVDAVHGRTNGIPLHIEELLAALDEDARHDGRAIREAVVPDTIEDAVLARVGKLSQDARATARAGAVIGRCFPPEVLAGVMDLPAAALDGPLEELVNASVLYPFDFLDKGFFDFRHQLLRDALYASIPPAELRRSHARAGEFGALIEGPSEIHASVHFERAGLRAQAYRTALAGAQSASAMSSRREAFELYQRAVANVPDDLAPLELAELYASYAEAAFAVDDVAVAQETALLTRRYYLEAGRPVDAAAALVGLANMAYREGRPASERHGLLDQAAAELGALPDSAERSLALADVRVMQALVEAQLGRTEHAAALLDDAQALDDAGGRVNQDDLDFVRAWITVLAGSADAGLAALLGVARRARNADRESVGATAYRVAAGLAVRVMDYGTAEVALREGLGYADEMEQSYCRHLMAATSAHVAWAGGRWDEAVRIAGMEIVEPGSRRGALSSRDALGFVAFGRGDIDRAQGLLEASLAGGRESDDVELILPALWGLAETALVAGEPRVAVAHCREAVSVAGAVGEQPLLVPFVVSGVRALVGDRRPGEAEAWAADMTALLAGRRELAGPALEHADGLLRLAAGATGIARNALERAVAGWDARGRIWEATWARLDLAGCLLRMNRFAQAASLLTETRATASRLDSRPLANRADELAVLARGRGSESAPWRPLTAREYEVARLIASGSTNGEIAGELGIAPKTASAHVEHILAKLGVARRSEVAVWVTTVSGESSGPRDPAQVALMGIRPAHH